MGSGIASPGQVLINTNYVHCVSLQGLRYHSELLAGYSCFITRKVTLWIRYFTLRGKSQLLQPGHFHEGASVHPGSTSPGCLRLVHGPPPGTPAMPQGHEHEPRCPQPKAWCQATPDCTSRGMAIAADSMLADDVTTYACFKASAPVADYSSSVLTLPF